MEADGKKAAATYEYEDALLISLIPD